METRSGLVPCRAPVQLKGCDVGERATNALNDVAKVSRERNVSVSRDAEKQIRNSSSLTRSTLMLNIAQGWKVFSGVPCEVSHWMFGPALRVMPQRANGSEKVMLGSKDDVVHQPLAVARVDHD